MNSTLIVIIFPDRERAENVYHSLRAMRRQEFYNLNESLVIARLPTGEIETYRIWADEPKADARALSSIARLIVELANAGRELDEQMVQDLQQAGIDPLFVSTIAPTLREEFSALFFLLPTHSTSDATGLGNVLSLFRGQIARTTLSPEARAYLETRRT